MTRIISIACCRLTARASSRGAVPNTSLPAGRCRSGCLIQSTNAAMPAWAISPSQDRFSADIRPNHGSRSSIAAIAAVPSVPVARSIRRTVSGCTRARAAPAPRGLPPSADPASQPDLAGCHEPGAENAGAHTSAPPGIA